MVFFEVIFVNFNYGYFSTGSIEGESNISIRYRRIAFGSSTIGFHKSYWNREISYGIKDLRTIIGSSCRRIFYIYFLELIWRITWWSSYLRRIFKQAKWTSRNDYPASHWKQEYWCDCASLANRSNFFQYARKEDPLSLPCSKDLLENSYGKQYWAGVLEIDVQGAFEVLQVK